MEQPISARRGAVLLLAGILLTPAVCMAQQPSTGSVPLRVAHRGGAGLAPENTLAAFRAGLDRKADAVELDVHLSRDGELVVMHDPNTARTTGVSRDIAEATLAELKKLDAAARFTGPPAGPQAIPTLQEVLDLIRGRCGVQIEIKVRGDGKRYPGIEEKVVQAVQRNGTAAVTTVLSFDFPTITAVKALDPALKTCALVSRAYLQSVGLGGPSRVAEEMAKLGADYVGVDKAWLSPALCDALRGRKLGVGVWTVDDAESMRRFAGMGVDFITSNRPDILAETVGR